MIENIMQTSFICTLLFVLVIRFHGDDEPDFGVKTVEVIGLLVSFAVCIVSILILIWQN